MTDTRELTIARNYDEGTVVVEMGSEDRARQLGPQAARTMASALRASTKMSSGGSPAVGRVADELESAADDIEDA